MQYPTGGSEVPIIPNTSQYILEDGTVVIYKSYILVKRYWIIEILILLDGNAIPILIHKGMGTIPYLILNINSIIKKNYIYLYGLSTKILKKIIYNTEMNKNIPILIDALNNSGGTLLQILDNKLSKPYPSFFKNNTALLTNSLLV